MTTRIQLQAPRPEAARQMVYIFAISGCLALAGAMAPGAAFVKVFVGIGICDCLVSAFSWLLMRRGAPAIWLLALGVGTALPVIAVAGRHAALPSSAVFVVLLFVWIGANFPPGVCWWLLPPSAAAYGYAVGPQHLTAGQSIPPLLVMLAGCVIVSETIARSMARLSAAEARLRVRASELRTLVEASMALNSLDTNLVLETAVTTLLRLGDDAAVIALIDSKTGRLRVTHAAGPIPPGAAEAVASGDRGITGRALRLDATVVENDYPSQPDALPTVADAGFRVMIATPVRTDETTLGVLLCASKGRGPCAPTHPDTVELLAAHVGRALRNATDYAHQEINAAYHATQASLDPLTGVGNRRHAQSLLSALQPGDTVLLFDLDHFKDVNDTLGHPAGDEVLRQFARFLRDNVRRGDGVARMGGEEFLVTLRADAHSDRAPRLVEQWRSDAPPTTVSAGLAVHRSDRTAAETLAAADSALYAAKGQGRDRTVAETA